MIRPTLLALALSTAPLPAAMAQPAPAADAASVTVTAKSLAVPDRPRTRTGAYKIASRGEHFTRARCTEGGNVIVPTHSDATPERRDRELREACKNIDYTK